MDGELNKVLEEYYYDGTVDGKKIPFNHFVDPAHKDFMGGFDFNLYNPDPENASNADFSTEDSRELIDISDKRINAGGLLQIQLQAKPVVVSESPFYKYKKANAYMKANPGKFEPAYDENDGKWHWGSVLEVEPGKYEYLKILPPEHKDFKKTVKEYQDDGKSLEDAKDMAFADLYTEDEIAAIESYNKGLQEERRRGGVIIEENGLVFSIYRGTSSEKVYNKYKELFMGIVPNLKEDVERDSNSLRDYINNDSLYDFELEEAIEDFKNIYRPEEWKEEFKKNPEILRMLNGS